MNATPTPTQAGLITLPKLTGGARHFPTRTRCFFLANSSSRSTTLRPLTETTRHTQILQPAMPSPVLFRRLAVKSMFDQFTEQVVRVITMIRDVASGHGGGSSGPKMSILDEYGTDLTKLAKEGKLDPVLVGREREMELLIRIFERKIKNSPCLIGKAGVGKTALVKRLAKLVADGVVRKLVGKKVIALNVGQLLVDTKYRDEFEEKLEVLLDDVKERDDIILFIDEIDTLIRAGSAYVSVAATYILMAALVGGKFLCIGATRVEDDPTLEKMFRVVKVSEPSVDETIQILHGLNKTYEIHHKVRYTDGALVAAAQLSQEYISDCFLPDKAIRLIEEAGSFVKLRHYAQAQEETRELFSELCQIIKEKYETVRGQNFQKAKELRDHEEELRAQITALINNGKEESKSEFVDPGPVVTEADIQHIVTLRTGMQFGEVSSDEYLRLLKMEEILHRRIIGQDEALKAIGKAIRCARIGLKDPKWPIGSFVFVGPNGVDKVELAKAVAACYFGSEDA